MKLAEKGDLQTMLTGGGITLLLVPSQILCRVLLYRIEEAINVKMRQEQSGSGEERIHISDNLTGWQCS